MSAHVQTDTVTLEPYVEAVAKAAPPESWRRGLPRLTDGVVTLRALAVSDAASLAARLHRPAVMAHIAPPPETADGFATFIRWSRIQVRRGAHICFGIVPPDTDEVVGVVQVWRVESDFSIAEWGVALADTHWGRGIASRASRLVFDFSFEVLRATRLEARVAAANENGLRLMAGVGATREGTLRHGFRRGDAVEDAEMWSVVASEWRSGQGRGWHADFRCPGSRYRAMSECTGKGNRVIA